MDCFCGLDEAPCKEVPYFVALLYYPSPMSERKRGLSQHRKSNGIDFDQVAYSFIQAPNCGSVQNRKNICNRYNARFSSFTTDRKIPDIAEVREDVAHNVDVGMHLGENSHW